MGPQRFDSVHKVVLVTLTVSGGSHGRAFRHLFATQMYKRHNLQNIIEVKQCVHLVQRYVKKKIGTEENNQGSMN